MKIKALLVLAAVALMPPMVYGEDLETIKAYFVEEEYDLAAQEFQKFIQTATDPKEKSEAQFYLAECYYQTKKYSQAKDAFREFLQMGQSSKRYPEGQYRIAECFYFLKDFKKAGRAFSRFIKDNPQHSLLPNALFAGAGAHLEVGEYEEALKAYQNLANNYPNHKKAQESQFNVGWVYMRNRSYQDAIQAFLDFNKRFPQSPLAAKALLRAADASFRKGDDYDRALDLYNRVLSEGQGAFKKEAHQGIAWSYYKKGEFDKAAHSFIKNAQATNQNDAKAEAYYQGIQSFYNAENAQSGLKAAEALIQQLPNHPLAIDALYWKGVFLKDLGRSDEAKSFLKQSLEKKSQEPAGTTSKVSQAEIYYELGSATSSTKQHSESINQLRTALSLVTDQALRNRILLELSRNYFKNKDPHNAIRVTQDILKSRTQDSKVLLLARFNLGQYYYSIKEYQKALEHYQWLIAQPKIDGKQKRRSLYWMGWCYKFLNQAPKAIQSFEQLIQEDKSKENTREAYFHLAELYASQGQRPKARQFYGNLIQNRGSYTADSIFALAQLDFKDKKYSAAKPYFVQLISKYPTHELRTDALYYAAECAWHMGEQDEAFGYYQTVISDKESKFRESSLYGVSWVHFEKQQYGKVLEYCDTLLKDYPKSEYSVSVHELKGRAYVKLNKLTEAQKEYELGLQRSKGQNREKFLIYQADILRDNKEYPQALGIYEKVLREYPSSRYAQQALYDKGWVLWQLKRVEEAKVALESYRSRYPKGDRMGDVNFALGEMHYEAKKFAAAVHYYSAASTSKFYLDMALYKMGWSYFHQKQFNEAAKQFKRLAVECPDSKLKMESIYREGQALSKAGQFEASAKAYSQYLKLSDRADRFYPEVVLNLARVLNKLGSLKSARAQYTDFLNLFATHKKAIDAHIELGDILKEQKLYAIAKTHYSKATKDKTHPSVLRAIEGYGECSFLSGEYTEAIKWYLQTLRYENANDVQARSLLRISQCHKSLGNTDKMCKYLKRLIKEFPQSSQVAQAKSEVASLCGESGGAN